MSSKGSQEKESDSESRQTLETTPTTDVSSVTIKTIAFSDGTTIALDPVDVVVLVGPNNAGKSMALVELEKHFNQTFAPTVVTSVEYRMAGDSEDFAAFLKKHARVKHNRFNSRESRWHYEGYRFSFSTGRNLIQEWPNSVQKFGPLFCMRLATESRITDSNPADSHNLLEQMPSNPIQMLYGDDDLEERISRYFRQAFGEDLILFLSGGSKLPLLVGQRPIPNRQKGEDRRSRSYIERVRDSTVPLMQQGDGMRSFASVILHMLAPITSSILILDEPEAFLHPPQARLLGEIIATGKSPRAQLFLATHSPDVLQGLINVAPEHLRVVRMQRDGNVNRIKELDKELVKKISSDPIMRYTSVLSGLFHERVIICEADADCTFYSSILDLSEVHGETHPDVLFVHANGKHRMATLAETLVALDVPVDIIADIDILNDEDVLRNVVEALAGDWSVVKPVAQTVKKAIEEHKPWLNATEVKKGIEGILERTPSSGEFPKKLRSEINNLFRKASPWDAVKAGGETVIPSGEATKKYHELQKLSSQMGLWIVPVGELERFCKSVGGHGPRWVQQVIEERNLATDPELESARKFVKQLWESKCSYASVDTAQVTES